MKVIITRMRSNPRYKLGRIFFFFFFFSWKSQIVTQVVIGYTNIVANGSSCCIFIRIQGCIYRNMEGHAVSFDIVSRDAQTLNLSRNVSNFYAGQVVSLIKGQLSQNLLPKVDLLSTIRNKFPQQRVDRER